MSQYCAGAVAAESVAVLRGAGQFAGGARVRRLLDRLHHDVDRQLLSGDAANVPTSGLSQRHRQRRPGRLGAQLPRRVLHRRGDLRHVVYHRVRAALHLLPVQVRLLQGHHEHLRRAGHSAVLRRPRCTGRTIIHLPSYLSRTCDELVTLSEIIIVFIVYFLH